MFAKTINLLFCGYAWTISINEGFYNCTTKFSEEDCKVAVECKTGEGSYDRASGIVSAITQSIELKCTDIVHTNTLNIYNKFAAAISCQKQEDSSK